MRQFGDVLSWINVCFGSLAAVETDSNPMTALARKADIQTGRVSALTDTGRSDALRSPQLDVR